MYTWGDKKNVLIKLCLPQHIWRHIFEYDSTFHDVYRSLWQNDCIHSEADMIRLRFIKNRIWNQHRPTRPLSLGVFRENMAKNQTVCSDMKEKTYCLMVYIIIHFRHLNFDSIVIQWILRGGIMLCFDGWSWSKLHRTRSGIDTPLPDFVPIDDFFVLDTVSVIVNDRIIPYITILSRDEYLHHYVYASGYPTNRVEHITVIDKFYILQCFHTAPHALNT
jgi:hypothetical protein